MDAVDQRIILHTNPNRITICWLTVGVIGAFFGLICFGWEAMLLESKAATIENHATVARHEAVVAKHEAVVAKQEAVTTKKKVGYLHDVAASNTNRLHNLERK